jgi:hypothetical protein
MTSQTKKEKQSRKYPSIRSGGALVELSVAPGNFTRERVEREECAARRMRRSAHASVDQTRANPINPCTSTIAVIIDADNDSKTLHDQEVHVGSVDARSTHSRYLPLLDWQRLSLLKQDLVRLAMMWKREGGPDHPSL